ncbi:Asp-tRNA(Asn)/Glu-tRNA(Gln) amidotransferase subunit GatC [Patescibacteria group bacterium]|nr:Asp-tRNA(Asn)/Glu-tRNA(Gln) amidotransferase subunit GatC [Patescibacteria group bacterium]MBU1563841.1 Asp-tRNA(Asn)/Glu-tRNA(Gln) amidotransferase subunit GatC [Patescibacteria group bacterium]MBU2068353.1 Asp-tRNA(Asn)/Glu-tRNA(Gln) amidotransferase subunit GatC [Patescibacteria group bacterium]
MAITKKEVEHIAKLARLGLSEQEKKKFTEELSAILSFVDKLNEIKIDKIEPTAQVTGLENITREDKGKKKTKKETDKLLNLVPEVENRHVKVKAIL